MLRMTIDKNAYNHKNDEIKSAFQVFIMQYAPLTCSFVLNFLINHVVMGIVPLFLANFISTPVQLSKFLVSL